MNEHCRWFWRMTPDIRDDAAFSDFAGQSIDNILRIMRRRDPLKLASFEFALGMSILQDRQEGRDV